MHRNLARAYDCLQDERDRISAACVKILSQVTRASNVSCSGQSSKVHDTTTKCFFTRSGCLDPSGDVFLI
jgi:hypothetical protein